MKAGHAGHLRRDGVRPYEIHPLDVWERVAPFTADEDIQIGALLHDVPEMIEEGVEPIHPEYGLEAIYREFGSTVEGFCYELNDRYTKVKYPTLNRKARKQLERIRYSQMSEGARLIKCCDISSNLSDLDEKDAGFSRMFLREKALCLPYLWDTKSVNYMLLIAWRETENILKEQSKRFDLRETPVILNPCPTTLN